MSETSLEATGKSVEDAVEKGLAELGLSRDAVAIQVMREGSRGLLGIGGEEAVVRLTPLARPSLASREPEPDTAPVPRGKRCERKHGLRSPRSHSKRCSTAWVYGARVQVLRDMASEDERAIVLNIVGDDLGILIGRRGETLRDLEYLTRLLVAQKTGKPAKLVVDVEGYRTRRERVLNELAKTHGGSGPDQPATDHARSHAAERTPHRAPGIARACGGDHPEHRRRRSPARHDLAQIVRSGPRQSTGKEARPHARRVPLFSPERGRARVDG